MSTLEILLLILLGTENAALVLVDMWERRVRARRIQRFDLN